MPLDDLYREIIMEHARNPQNRGPLAGATFQVGLNNPTCGDEIVLFVDLDDEARVKEAKFEGQGCTISMAAASMMTEAIRGKTLGEALALSARYREMLLGKDDHLDDLGDLALLKGVTQFPMRVKCAALAFTALEKGITHHKEAALHGQE